MARSRNLKPAFFSNEDLASVPPLGRLLFQGLWCMADRAGRLEDRPLRIKATILPYDNCEIEPLLLSLVNSGFIVRYSIESKHYIQIVNFEKHQNPHVKEQESTIPAPGNNQASMVQNVPLPSSLFPLPDSPIPITPPKPEMRFNFDMIWERYPRPLGKKPARKHFEATVKTMQDFLDIQNALANYLLEIKRRGTEEQYIKHGSTWFNNWRDYVNYKPPERESNPQPVRAGSGYIGHEAAEGVVYGKPDAGPLSQEEFIKFKAEDDRKQRERKAQNATANEGGSSAGVTAGVGKNKAHGENPRPESQ